MHYDALLVLCNKYMIYRVWRSTVVACQLRVCCNHHERHEFSRACAARRDCTVNLYQIQANYSETVTEGGAGEGALAGGLGERQTPKWLIRRCPPLPLLSLQEQF